MKYTHYYTVLIIYFQKFKYMCISGTKSCNHVTKWKKNSWRWIILSAIAKKNAIHCDRRFTVADQQNENISLSFVEVIKAELFSQYFMNYALSNDLLNKQLYMYATICQLYCLNQRFIF